MQGKVEESNSSHVPNLDLAVTQLLDGKQELILGTRSL